jgi:LPXTG-site transpeptidase (sortase) family protein
LNTATGRRPRGSSILGAAGLVAVMIAGGALLPGSVPRDELSNAVGVTTSPVAGPGAGPTTVTSSSAPGRQVPEARPSATQVADAPTAAGPDPTPDIAAVVPATTTAPSPTSIAPATTSTAPNDTAMPAIAPSPALTLSIPSIDVDAPVLPVDSLPTGRTNAWGGPIYQRIDFPVDDAVRQWIRRGDPNSLPASKSASTVKAFDRVVIYGHASDIGNHLVFQDLSALKIGARVVVTTAKGRFTYRTTVVTTSRKTDLDQYAPLYDYPQQGRKEIALVACLPDTSLNTVVIGRLVSATQT